MGEKSIVQRDVRICRQAAAAILVFSFLVISFFSNIHAASYKPAKVLKRAPKLKIASGIKLETFQSEKISGAVKLSWRTNFETNILGFRIWREVSGQRETVNEEMIAGSFLKAGSGALQNGDEYNFYGNSGSQEFSYWLEAIDLNNESRWFGPVFARTGSEEKFEESSKTLSELAKERNQSRKQIDRLESAQAPEDKESTIEADTADILSQTDLAKDGNALKFEVRQDGWYRVNGQIMLQNGFSLETANNWQLFTDGREQSMQVNADGSIEFYGRGIDTLQSDAKMYWLVTHTEPGKRIGTASQKNTQSASTGWSRVIAERKDRIIRTSNVLNGAKENWYGAVVNQTEAIQTLNLTEIAAESGETAALSIDIQGLGNQMPHRVSVTLNGTTVGQINFNDLERMEWTVNVPLALLLAGENQVNLRSVSPTTDVSLLEAVRINYPRRSTAVNNRLIFALQAKRSVKLKGFAAPSVKVFDITIPENTIQILPTVRLETDGTYSAAISSKTAARVLMAQDDTASVLAIGSWTKNISSDLHNPQNQANFVIIAPPQFHSNLTTLKIAREAQGLRTMIVDPADIYDEFNGGVKSAEALRSFLQFARQNWIVKPDYSMLVGDASVDPRNYSGSGGDSVNFIPTMITDTWNMETTSDEMIADFNNDEIEDISLGRLPVRNNSELTAILNKIMAHETFSAQEIKQRGVLMVSDAFIGYNFSAGSRNTASTIPAGINVNYIDVGTNDPAVIRRNVLDSMNAGPAVVNYFGHSTITVWTGAGIFHSSDAFALTNYSRPSLSVMLSCLSGSYAEINYEALAEAMLKAPNGGAFAVWAATGWNGAEEQEFMGKEFYRRVFLGMRLGDAAREAKLTTNSIDQRRTYMLFGDPTQRLIRP